jgi:hypothetical protein
MTSELELDVITSELEFVTVVSELELESSKLDIGSTSWATALSSPQAISASVADTASVCSDFILFLLITTNLSVI